MAFKECPLKDKDRLMLVLKKKPGDCPGCYEKDDNNVIVLKSPCLNCAYHDKELEVPAHKYHWPTTSCPPSPPSPPFPPYYAPYTTSTSTTYTTNTTTTNDSNGYPSSSYTYRTYYEK